MPKIWECRSLNWICKTGYAATCVIVLTGQISSQTIHAISHGVCTAMVSNGLINPDSWGQTATQAPQLMQAFHPISKMTACFRFIVRLFCKWKMG